MHISKLRIWTKHIDRQWRPVSIRKIQSLTSLTIFSDVCQASGDLINQVQTVKRILELLMEMEMEMEGGSSLSNNNDENGVKKDKMIERLNKIFRIPYNDAVQ